MAERSAVVAKAGTDDFLAGAEPFPGAGFTYEDETWDLEPWKTSATAPSDNVLSFSGCPLWLKPMVKAYIAWGWLSEDYSNSWCQSKLSKLRWLYEYLGTLRPDIQHIAELDNGVAEGFGLYLQANTTPLNASRVAEYVGEFARWVKKKYGFPRVFRPQNYTTHVKHRRPSPSQTALRVIPTEVSEQLLRAAGVRHREIWARWTSKPPSKRPRGSEMLYIQVLKVLLGTPLRVSQVLLLKRNPIRESRGKEEPGVWLSFDESKTHQGEQEVYVPEEYAGIVREAVVVAREYTARLYRESGIDLLFLTSAPGGGAGSRIVRGLSANAFRTWLNGYRDAEGNVTRPGFIHRNDIKYNGEYYYVDPHQTRHTMATQIYNGGGGFGTVTEQLVHRSGVMTSTYTHGGEKDRADLIEAMDRGSRSEGSTADLVDREVFRGRISDQDIERQKGMSRYLQPTVFGFCTQPVSSPPCSFPHHFWMDPRLYAKERVGAYSSGWDDIDEDMRVLERQVELWGKEYPDSPFLHNVRAARVYYERMLEGVRGTGNKEVELEILDEHNPRQIPPPAPPKVRVRYPKRNLPAYREKLVDGQTRLERALAALAQIEASGVAMTVREFANTIGVSDNWVYRNLPEEASVLVQMRKSGVPTPERKAILDRIGYEWQLQVASGEALTVAAFARKCGLDRNRFYKDFPDWGRKIRAHYLESHPPKERKPKAPGAVNSHARFREIEEHAEAAFALLQTDNAHISLTEFAERVGVSLHVLLESHKGICEKLKAWNSGVAIPHRPQIQRIERRRKGLEEKFEREWAKTEESGQKVTLLEFAVICGVDRNVFYKEFPEWVEKIAAANDPAQLWGRIEAALPGALDRRPPMSVLEFSKTVGVHRNVLYRHFPDVVTQLKAAKRVGEAHA